MGFYPHLFSACPIINTKFGANPMIEIKFAGLLLIEFCFLFYAILIVQMGQLGTKVISIFKKRFEGEYTPFLFNLQMGPDYNPCKIGANSI